MKRWMSAEERTELADRKRKQPVSRFAGMTVDMDYMLCIPSVHAVYRGEEMIVDFGGGVRKRTDGFPPEKAELLIRWVHLHEREIMDNHRRIGQEDEPLIPIQPPDE